MCGGPAIDVGGDDVRLDLVTGDRVGVGRVPLTGLRRSNSSTARLPRPWIGVGQDHPGGGVGVLAAILSDAGDVPLDVAGLELPLVERGGEQEDQPVASRGPAGSSTASIAWRRPVGVGDPGDRGPGLGDRVDLALVVGRRAERRPVVEVGPAIPSQPSQAWASIAARRASARSRQVAARAESPRASAISAKWRRAAIWNQAVPDALALALRRRRGSCRRSSRRSPSADQAVGPRSVGPGRGPGQQWS